MVNERNNIGEATDENLESCREDVEAADHIEEETVAKNEFETVLAEKEELFNRLQRLQADFENFRRRTRQEKEEIVKFSTEGIICQLLPVLDNFERALASVNQGNDLEKFREGVEMIFRQLMQTLANEGLAVMEAVGCPFDPNCHNAVQKVENADYPENTVIEELQRGFKLKDKVIRPSLVKVSG